MQFTVYTPDNLSVNIKRPRNPAEIRKARKKKTYSFSLIESNVETLRRLADKDQIPLSELVDEAIDWYLKAIRDVDNK